MSLDPGMKDMEPGERERIRRNLLAYCRLNPPAVANVWEELRRVAEW